MVDMLFKIDPEKYANKVVIIWRKKYIYAVLLKELYRTLFESLLLFKDLINTLYGWVFEPNPYDTCVVKKQWVGKNSLCYGMLTILINITLIQR